MKFIWLLALLLISGKAFAWPDWVLQPAQNEQQLVGVGIGQTRVEAKELAMAEIVTQLSVRVETEQSQLLAKSGDQSRQEFRQQTRLSSLPFELFGVQEINSAQQEQQVAVMLAVDKSAMAITLADQVEALLDSYSQMSGDPVKGFVAAVKQMGLIPLGRNYLAAMRGLGYPNEAQELRHKALSEEILAAKSRVSVEVIGSKQHQQIYSYLATGFTASANAETRLWLRPELKWRTAKQAGRVVARADLQLSYQYPQSPFTVVHRQSLSADGVAFSQAQAKEQALNAIIEQLKQPPSEWNTGSDTL
ncbi:LPP20 family lipoprotein [Shewanella corallii]|uniref:LPP20 family lipoprotein n=1 Tax=Shewanella corallii TaxID=560080 RepID=A0ABT0NCU1_9GAMM|nr:LPP20 family lipoprotein [Shewanella corallii]MCL2916286.1 LPP20 family lipoprotein [Shewanella corallii]